MEKNIIEVAKDVSKPDKSIRSNNKLIIIKWEEEIKREWIEVYYYYIVIENNAGQIKIKCNQNVEGYKYK